MACQRRHERLKIATKDLHSKFRPWLFFHITFESNMWVKVRIVVPDRRLRVGEQIVGAEIIKGKVKLSQSWDPRHEGWVFWCSLNKNTDLSSTCFEWETTSLVLHTSIDEKLHFGLLRLKHAKHDQLHNQCSQCKSQKQTNKQTK